MDENRPQTVGNRPKDRERTGLGRPPGRSHLHHVYYWLAGFDLVTVLISLGIITFVAWRFEETVDTNRIWTERLDFYSHFSEQAAAVVGPANNAFDAGKDRATEERAFRSSAGSFEAWMAALDEDCDTLDTVDDAPRLPPAAKGLLEAERTELGTGMHGGATFGEVYEVMETRHRAMGVKANSIFELLGLAAAAATPEDRVDHEQKAGRQMARMDADYYACNANLGKLRHRAGEQQRAELERQGQIVFWLPRIEMVLAGLILVMVTYWTVYGRRLAREMKERSHELEDEVLARTEELETTHQRLRLSERLASIGTLAAGLGHDMNNVLFPVKCRLDALDDAALEPSARSEVTAMRGSVDYLQQLSDGLRLLALDPDRDDDADAGGGTTELGSWWEEVRPLFLTALPSNATLIGDIPHDIPPVAVAPHRLTQALFNLVVNAGEAIGDGGTVRVWAAGADGMVGVGVSDTGHGMSEDVRRQALDPFFTTKKRELSTGLGLALVHGVAGGCGGSVDIESEVGRGTTVRLTLPAAPIEAKPRGAPADENRATVSLEDRRIATFVGSLLKSAGFEVEIDDDLRGDPPEEGPLWVTEPDAPPDAGRRFLEGDRPRRVLVVGEAAEEWLALGAIPMARSADFETIRETIGQALASLSGDQA